MTRATRLWFISCVLVIALIAVAAPGWAVVNQGSGQPARPYVIEGLVTVVFADEADLGKYNDGFGKANFALTSLDQVLEAFQVGEARKIFPWETESPAAGSTMPDYTRYYEMSFPPDIPVADVIAALETSPHVARAEPVWALPMSITPNDPQFNNQWHMLSTMMNVRGAWDWETGSDSIIIAIIDSGVDYDHSDLKGNIWVNPGEDVDGDKVVYDLDDLNGVDDDHNGVVDDLIGYDFLTGISGCIDPDCVTPDPDPDDYNGHGTHCTGIAAAMTNNGAIVTGMAGGWYGGHRSYMGAKIMCLRVGATASDGNGYVNSNNCGTAIQYAARNGAHIINCSWGSQGTSPMVAGMALVDSAGVTICHAAGNDNAPDSDYLDYDPAGVNVLSVASVENNDVKSGFSNFGPRIDVCAYGGNIRSTIPGGGTANYWGTSMSAPMVCGLAALVRSAMPSLSKEQVDSVIIATCHNIDDVNPDHVGELGAGRIDAEAALAGLASARFSADQTEGRAPMAVQFADESPYFPTDWQWSFGNGDVSSDRNPNYTYTEPGVYDVSLIVDDSVTLGPGEEHLTDYVWVTADTIKMDSIQLDPGTSGVMSVRLTNSIQISEIQFTFDWANSDGITFDSFSVAGTRTDYFDDVQMNVSYITIQGILMTPDPPNSTTNWLPPDTGVIMNLYFTAAVSATPGALVTIDTVGFGNKTSYCETRLGDYMPEVIAGKIYVVSCGRGDVTCDGAINIEDLVMLVTYMFQEGPAPDPFFTTDIDANGTFADIADLVYLVTYMFQDGPPPPAL